MSSAKFFFRVEKCARKRTMRLMGDAQEKLKSRARLWLRSERALGLTSLPLQRRALVEARPFEIERPTPAQAPRPLPEPRKTGPKVAPPDPVAARAGLAPPPPSR